MKEFHDDTADRAKEAVQQGTVFEKKRTEFFVNRKNEMAMGPVEQFKRHFSGTVNAIFIAAGGAKLGMASERDKFKITTMRASIHGTAIGRIPTINHLFDIFHHNRTRMKDILNFFKMLCEYFL